MILIPWFFFGMGIVLTMTEAYGPATCVLAIGLYFRD